MQMKDSLRILSAIVLSPLAIVLAVFLAISVVYGGFGGDWHLLGKTFFFSFVKFYPSALFGTTIGAMAFLPFVNLKLRFPIFVALSSASALGAYVIIGGGKMHSNIGLGLSCAVAFSVTYYLLIRISGKDA